MFIGSGGVWVLFFFFPILGVGVLCWNKSFDNAAGGYLVFEATKGQ